MAEKDPVIRELLRSGQKIKALKLYRQCHGGDLKEVKDAIDALESDNGITGYPSDADRWEQITDPTFRETLEAQIRAGRRIAAIQLYREKYPEPLKYAKQQVLAWGRVLGCGSLSVESEGEKPVEHFDIRWNETIHPEKRFLFWKAEDAFVEFGFELQLGERTFSDAVVPLSWQDLIESKTTDGEYEIIICDDDIDCCVEIVHFDGCTLWYARDDGAWHVFEETNYKATISRFEVAVLTLAHRYPNMHVKFRVS